MADDKRFQHVLTDPKFRRIPKGQRKVKIDKRFQSMFNDNKFKLKYTVDKRGRPINHSTAEDLKRYYDLSSEDENSSSEEEKSSDEDNEVQKSEQKKSTSAKEKSPESGTLYKKDAIDKAIPDKIKKKLKNLNVDYARGEGLLLSDSSSDDDEEESDNDQQVEDSFDHKWGELDADAEKTDEITPRLAACNMDWDRIRAVDLMVLFNSFLPSGGVIKSVVIYPSEFGKQRMAEEEVKGPIELVEKNDLENEDESAEGSKYHMEKLRKYQLNRLKYYYAVITCDSANTANKIYTECDGMEYESTATKIDLRFIPDDVSFEEDEPKETCNKMPDTNKYKPRYFTTTALQQAKVDLTWDETNPERLEITQKLANGKVDDIADEDLQNYLASSSGEESDENAENNEELQNDAEDNDNSIDKYKMLLQEIEEKEKKKNKEDVGVEISWGIDLQQKTEKLIKEKKDAAEQKTPFEQFLEKRKAKRKEKRLQKQNANEEDHDDSDVPSDIDMNDPYFAEEFNKPEFKKGKKPTSKTETVSEESSEDEEERHKREQQLELLLNDDEDDGKKHFSLKKIQELENDSNSKKKKRKQKLEKGVEDNFKINVDDDRFSALYNSHHYNIDPTDPHFKKTKNMEKLISEKIKRRTQEDDQSNTSSKKQKTDKKLNAELNVLVKSVKRKTESFKTKK